MLLMQLKRAGLRYLTCYQNDERAHNSLISVCCAKRHALILSRNKIEKG